MQSINIELDEATFEKAQSYAVSHNTSIPTMLVNYLHEVTATGIPRESAVRRLMELSRSATGEVGARSWTRDDLYER